MFFYYKIDHLSSKLFKKHSVLIWSLMNLFFVKSIVGYDLSGYMTILLSVYFISSAMIDYHFGFIYSIFSYIVILIFVFRGEFNLGECLVFIVYLKLFELRSVYGGGDTEYIFILYLFNYTLGEFALEKTTLVFILAFGVHTLQYWKNKGKKPFTPHLIIAELILLNLKGVLY